MKSFVIRIVLFLGVVVGVAEVLLRTIIPACETPFRAQDEQFGILRYTTQTITGLYTSGRLAQQQSRWRINNHGWNAGIDYQPPEKRRKPCIALISDSYLEGFYSDWDQHLAKLLYDNLDAEYDVYSLGVSDANLLQYLAISRYATHHFAPEIMVFFIQNGDILASLTDYAKPSFNYMFDYENGQLIVQPPLKYRRYWYRSLARFSAIARYLYLNAEMMGVDFSGSVIPGVNVREQRARVDQVLLDRKPQAILLAADYVIRTIKSENPDVKLLFVMDGNRKAIYAGETPLVPHPSSQILKRICKHYQVPFFDLTIAFGREYPKNKQKFDFNHNFHWNPYAFEIVAKAVKEYLWDQGLVK